MTNNSVGESASGNSTAGEQFPDAPHKVPETGEHTDGQLWWNNSVLQTAPKQIIRT